MCVKNPYKWTPPEILASCSSVTPPGAAPSPRNSAPCRSNCRPAGTCGWPASSVETPRRTSPHSPHCSKQVNTNVQLQSMLILQL